MIKIAPNEVRVITGERTGDRFKPKLQLALLHISRQTGDITGATRFATVKLEFKDGYWRVVGLDVNKGAAGPLIDYARGVLAQAIRDEWCYSQVCGIFSKDLDEAMKHMKGTK